MFTMEKFGSLRIAAETDNKEFVAHSSCQSLLKLWWCGELEFEEEKRFKVKRLLME